jgi:hypothetical protein
MAVRIVYLVAVRVLGSLALLSAAPRTRRCASPRMTRPRPSWPDRAWLGPDTAPALTSPRTGTGAVSHR